MRDPAAGTQPTMKAPELDKPVARKARRFIDGANYLPSYLSHINNRLASGASQLYLRLYGVGINEWRILSVLSNWPRSTALAIGDTVAMHKTVVSRSLHEMQDKGLVRIVRAQGQRLCALTPAGQKLHDRIVVVALKREALLVKGFSAEERGSLIGLLRRLLDNVDAVNSWEPAAAPVAVRRRAV
jgi:DNA-binding MarR family transcriptional regulator